MRLLIIAAIVSSPGVALADQAIELHSVGLTIQAPDDWVAEVNALGGDELRHDSGWSIGRVSSFDDECATVTATARGFEQGPILAENVVPLEGWSGFEYQDLMKSSEPFGAYCRAFSPDGTRRRSVTVTGYTAEVPALIALVEAALDAESARRFNGAASAPASQGEQTIELRFTPYGRQVALALHVPDDWRSSQPSEVVIIQRGAYLIGNVIMFPSNCEEALAANGGASSREASVPIAGWTGRDSTLQEGSLSTYCREFSVDHYAAIVFGPTGVVSALVAAVDAALEVAYPPYVRAPPTAFEKYGPTRYDLALARFTDGDSFFDDEGWGVGLGIAYAPWRQKIGPTWSGQLHFLATGAGVPFTAEVGVGVSLKALALQGIVGVGSASDSAPFGPHAGGQVDLMLVRRDWHGAGGGLDVMASHVWLDGGTATRIDGGFVAMFGKRGVAVRFGWERRLEGRTIGISIGTQTLPLPE